MTTATDSTVDIRPDIAATLVAMQQAHDALPLDDSLATPKEVEQNFVRRSLLRDTGSRLRLDCHHVEQLEPQLVMLRDWITTLRACQREFETKLAEAEDAERHNTVQRAYYRAEAVRQSLRDILRGPDLVGQHEVMLDILVAWFREHRISPLPGESALFAGRGGLLSATDRLSNVTASITKAHDEVARSLRAAKQLLAGPANVEQPPVS